MYEVLRKYSEDKKMRVKVYYDEGSNPRKDFDNCTHFILSNGYGDSDDVQGTLWQLCEDYGIEDYENENFLTLINKLKDYIAIDPVSMYSHSGDTIFFGAPNDRWDSGYIGFAYAELSDIEGPMCGRNSKDYPDWRDQAYAILEGDMADLDRAVRGEVYGFVEEKLNEPSDEMRSAPEYDEEWWSNNDENWTETDSCWNFYEDANELADDVLRGAA
jgi:hypothetical protein